MQNYTGTLYPSFGAVIDVETPNQHGAISYLIATQGTTWMMFDPWDGTWVFNITDVPSGTMKLWSQRRTYHLPNKPRKQMDSFMELHKRRK